VAIRLSIESPNLYMMTSEWMAKGLPQELVRFMRTRGQDEILWVSEHPVLSMCLSLERVDAKLSNDNFLAKAPEHVVEGERERRVEAEQTRAKLTEALARLEAA